MNASQITLSFRSSSVADAVSAFASEMEAAGICVEIEKRLYPVFMAAGKWPKTPTAVMLIISHMVIEGFFNAGGAAALQAATTSLWNLVSRTSSSSVTSPGVRPDIFVVSCEFEGGSRMRFSLPAGLESSEYERPVEAMMEMIHDCVLASADDGPEPFTNHGSGRGAAYLEFSGGIGSWVQFRSSEDAEDLHRHLSDLSSSPQSAWD